MPLIESFTVDHTRMEAPGVRLAKELKTPKGDTIRVFDLRLCRPNREIISPEGLHTLEHLLAGFLRKHLPNYTIIDVSPMGCRTGFYMSVIGTPTPEEVAKGLEKGMEEVLKTQQIPEANIYQCGSCYLHSIEKAKRVAKRVLERGIKIIESEPLRLEMERVPEECPVSPNSVEII
ncbi:MAG: S-ribosylhomocysteine lyase [Campylobacterales bacterium]